MQAVHCPVLIRAKGQSHLRVVVPASDWNNAHQEALEMFRALAQRADGDLLVEELAPTDLSTCKEKQ
jgi:hypothetical protein